MGQLGKTKVCAKYGVKAIDLTKEERDAIHLLGMSWDCNDHCYFGGLDECNDIRCVRSNKHWYYVKEEL